jgi:hypothetical protein
LVEGVVWGVVTLTVGLVFAFGALGARDEPPRIPETAAIPSEPEPQPRPEEPPAEPAEADSPSTAAQEPAEPPAEPDPPPEPAPPDEEIEDPGELPPVGSDGAELDCTIDPDTAQTLLVVDPAVQLRLDDAGVRLTPISPAAAAADGIEFPVRSASRISCDELSGFIGHLGGMAFTKGQQRVELRRYRVDLASGEVIAFPRSSGSDAIAPFGLAMGQASSVGINGFIARDVPMSLTASGARTLNDGLGEPLFADEDVIGQMTFAGERMR